jgi:threonine dehydratase
MMARPTLADIRQAHERIRPFIHRTPVLTCDAIDERVGSRLYFKCENFQKAGAFKSRGACNAVFSLSDAAVRRGVATHSSGNHAAALARAAKLRGVPAYIVMPTSAPEVKQQAVRGYGGEITFCLPTQKDREATAERIVADTGATMIHPYNNERIIAGQGTAAIELLEDIPDLDVVMTPVGGGGLLSGTAIAAKAINPRIRVMAGEPALADDAFRSLREQRIVPSDNPQTIADGLRTSLGDQTFPIIRDLVDGILLADEDEILDATQLIMERMKIIVEPSGVVPLAALFTRSSNLAGKRIGIILSGGNVDWSKLNFRGVGSHVN